jgi:hypothetical protein
LLNIYGFWWGCVKFEVAAACSIDIAYQSASGISDPTWDDIRQTHTVMIQLDTLMNEFIFFVYVFWITK